MNTRQFYDFVLKIHGIAKIGMVIQRSLRHSQLRGNQQLSRDMLEQFMSVKFERPSYFAREVYPTPTSASARCL
jgi:hypothetical protein